MCGIYGIAGRGIIKDDLKVFYELGMANMLRGQDSTGYFETQSNGRNEKLIKRTWDFSAFSDHHVKAKNYKERILDNISSELIMGHNRWATVGPVTEINAQPMKVNNVVLTHNGTLVDGKYMDKDKQISDSFFFTMDIEENGVSHVLRNLDKRSAYAIAMWDSKTKKLTFSRNFSRPLWYAINHDRSVLYYSSERDALTWILNRNSIHYKGWEKDAKGQNVSYGGAFEFMPGAIYECSLTEIRPRATIFKVIDRTIWWDNNEKKYIYAKDLIDEEANKIKEKEMLSSAKEEKLTFTPKVIGPSSSIEKRAEEAKNSTVIPFEPPYKPVQQGSGGRVLHSFCGSCGKKLSVHEQYLIRNELASGYYQTSTGVYHCSCVGSGATKESVKSEKTVH